MTAVNNIIINGMSFALPLFIMAIGGIYSERSGITNLALEGLQGMGAFTGALVAYCLIRSMGGTSQVPYYMAMLFAMIGGAVYSMLHAALCIKFKANQVISGVVVNILAMALTSFLTKTINRNVFGQLLISLSLAFPRELRSRDCHRSRFWEHSLPMYIRLNF